MTLHYPTKSLFQPQIPLASAHWWSWKMPILCPASWDPAFPSLFAHLHVGEESHVQLNTPTERTSAFLWSNLETQRCLGFPFPLPAHPLQLHFLNHWILSTSFIHLWLWPCCNCPNDTISYQLLQQTLFIICIHTWHMYILLSIVWVTVTMWTIYYPLLNNLLLSTV